MVPVLLPGAYRRYEGTTTAVRRSTCHISTTFRQARVWGVICGLLLLRCCTRYQVCMQQPDTMYRYVLDGYDRSRLFVVLSIWYFLRRYNQRINQSLAMRARVALRRSYTAESSAICSRLRTPYGYRFYWGDGETARARRRERACLHASMYVRCSRSCGYLFLENVKNLKVGPTTINTAVITSGG